MRVVTTPLPGAVPLPAPRPLGGLADSLLQAIVAAPGIASALDRLRHPETLVVTTGQQPGLFTGPGYTVYKALSAAALARELERRWSRPVVAVFWLASDDHDFSEARWASWLSVEGDLVTAALPERDANAPLTPLYRTPLGPEITALLQQLEETLPASEFRDTTLAWLRRHYVPEATVAEACRGALAELVGQWGVVCLDSTHPAVKNAAAPLILKALELAEPLERALVARAHDLETAGTPAGVAVGDGTTLAFLEHEAGRDRLLRDGDAFLTRRGLRRVTRAELVRIADREAWRLSPNVLLRPVIESALLPTVAYVAGPGELTYLPLAAPLYDALEVPAQVAVPRWSGVVVEPRVDRVLAKFGAALEELMTPGQQLEARVVRAQLPAAAVDAAARLRRAIEAEYDALLPAVRSVDPTLERPTVAARQQALRGLAELEKKVAQHLRKREAVELAQIARARTAVLPRGLPQERVLTAACWLGRYGPAFLDDVFARIEEWYAAALVGRTATS
jgi:bacillithiol biosynthesis cysteine-adding enzyme BshC